MPLFAGFAALSAADKLKKVLPFIAIAAVVALVLALTYCQGKSAGKNAEVREQLEEQIETLEIVDEADETAGGERVDDAAALDTQEEELEDARTTQGDDANTRRARSLCRKLRQQGGDTANHPTCCRFEGEGGTCATP